MYNNSRSPSKVQFIHSLELKEAEISALQAENMTMKKQDLPYQTLLSEYYSLHHKFNNESAALETLIVEDKLASNKNTKLITELQLEQKELHAKKSDLNIALEELNILEKRLEGKMEECEEIDIKKDQQTKQNIEKTEQIKQIENALREERSQQNQEEIKIDFLKEEENTLRLQINLQYEQTKDMEKEQNTLSQKEEENTKNKSSVHETIQFLSSQTEAERIKRRTLQDSIDLSLRSHTQHNNDIAALSKHSYQHSACINHLEVASANYASDISATQQSLALNNDKLENAKNAAVKMLGHIENTKADLQNLRVLSAKKEEEIKEEKNGLEEERKKFLVLSGEKEKLWNNVKEKEEIADRVSRELKFVVEEKESVGEKARELEEEINALQEHVSNLMINNKGLEGEIEKFVEEDERIRQELDRKEKIAALRKQNQIQYLQSLQKLKDASPMKRSQNQQLTSPNPNKES
jgi:hypothetical protein